ncbi:MAG TPA: neutral/alkaline non-lysosomal ceramidase N-terminal domain-containing protein [bacterium]|nr:hypothetical protein [Candidatus Omnitrophota bacterium]HOJ60612.1 neutral/alkaline non-lysosomal ceramidase N-terminal domain-containing protein [bacterium]HOL95028.1 neutral/alkaline non-lysosomal ceramidase N-terminal domain-containing protein [bacterium]HPP01004.1 neutral/alkaline non-lysosomal ceramidase N-terminal domain-containing protein [bacterium]HXK94861.1 neutral/alkaline non-lysosomal ceramidase N-terminal domain-containing protein [bacterium]
MDTYYPHSIRLFMGAMLIFLTALGTIPQARALDVGVASVEITPPTGIPMPGYAARKQPSQGVWDPLFAKGLVLDDGSRRAAFVVLDLISPPPKDMRNRIQEQVKKKHNISLLLFLATHTHAGPVLKPDVPTPDNPWLPTLEEKILQAVDKAVAAKISVTVEVGYGTADLTYDRRVVNPDGTVKMLWRNAERTPGDPVDQTVGVVGFKKKNGQWLATVVHFAGHPVIFGSDNLKYSAEWPGAMRRFVEKQLGGECLFFQGACGVANPYLANTPATEEGYAVLMQEGQTLGEEVVRIAGVTNPISSAMPALNLSTETIPLQYRFDFNNEKVREFYIQQYGKERFEEMLKERPAEILAEIPIVILGKEIAWVGFPGEFFDEFQVDLRERSPVPNTFFLGYCNDVFGYFPTIQAAAEGGYGAGYSTYVEVGAGEYLVNRAVINLHRMLGRLKPVPEM